MKTAAHLWVAVIAVAIYVAGPMRGHGEVGARQETGDTPGDTLAIIVNHRNPVSGLSLADLRRIFMLETQYWPHGPRIIVVLREPAQPERALALRLICSMSEEQYRLHLLHETFRGRVNTSALRSIRTADDMRAFVFNAPNSIGHVSVTDLDDTVKALRIEGRAPSDPRYPLVPERQRSLDPRRKAAGWFSRVR